MGSSVHSALRDFFRLSKSQRSLQNLGKLLKKNWISKGCKNNKEEKEYVLRGQMLSQFYETYDPYIMPLMVERNFSVKVEENLIFSVRIDRVDRLPNGGFELIDYKTGKKLTLEKKMKTCSSPSTTLPCSTATE